MSNKIFHFLSRFAVKFYLQRTETDSVLSYKLIAKFTLDNYTEIAFEVLFHGNGMLWHSILMNGAILET